MPTHSHHPPIASRHVWVRGAAFGPLSLCRNVVFHHKLGLLAVAAKTNTAMPPAPRAPAGPWPSPPSTVVDVYLHAGHGYGLPQPHGPVPLPGVHNKCPPQPCGAGNVPDTLPHPSAPSLAEQPCWGIPRIHKGVQETNPQDCSPTQ